MAYVAKTRFKKRVNGEVKEVEMSHNDYSVRLSAVRVTPQVAEKIKNHLERNGLSFSEFQRMVYDGFFEAHS